MSQRAVPAGPGEGAEDARLAAMLRVDHAGELAAVQIYRGQKAVLSAAPSTAALGARMGELEAHEAVHLTRFDGILNERRIRPTLLAPLWRAAGFALGAGTALIGEKAAHACTEAVESVIEAHYAEQIAELQARQPELATELGKFRQDELVHRDEAISQGARQAPAYAALTAVIRAGCRAAIKLSERI